MSTFYDPGPIPGWPIGRPAGSARTPATGPAEAADATGASPGVGTTAGSATTTITAAPVTTATAVAPDMQRITNVEAARGREARVRALRDALQAAAARLEATEPVSLREFHDELRAGCASIQTGDLGAEAVTIGQQFEAFFERLRGLAEAHAEPVPTTALGLDDDARFLRDMAEFLTRYFAL